MLVYILSDHDEYGAENVTATLDPEKLYALIEENWPLPKEESWKGQHIAYRKKWAEAREGLKKILALPEEERVRAPRDLQSGWGGIQLHVVELK